jgi:hypothetical protein
VAADFNRDGHLDIVIGGQSGVYFLPGNGDGTLGTPVPSATESALEGGLAAGDFNADGILDLVVTNPLLGTVSILIGNGDGTFKAPVDYATGTVPGSVATGDFNGDGKLDLAVIDGAGATVSILLGNGDGTFKPQVEYPAAVSANSVTIGDYNGDGILDLAVSDSQCTNSGCPANGSFNILLGNGDGTFQSQLNFAAGFAPTLVVTTALVAPSDTPPGRAGIAVASFSDNAISIFSPLPSQSNGNNPAPTITSLSPASAVEGGGSFTLTVNGSNFVASSTISFAGVTEATTFVSALQLTAAIPASAIAAPGQVGVYVTTPPPGGGTATTNFSIYLPAPTISSIVPSGVLVGSPPFTLTITGTNFVNGSTVNFNGASRVSTFVSSAQVTIPVSTSDVMNAGTITISVTDPQGLNNGGGGTSPTLPLTVLPTNGTPTITSLTPDVAASGGPAFTLQISGSGFGTSSVVMFGSATVSSAYASPAMLQASIPASAIAAAGMPLVTVTNPGGSPSAGAPFTVSGSGNNPVPVAVSLSPASVPAGNSSLTLSVTGSNFIPASVVQVNGSARPTSYVTSTSLTATLPATDFAHSGTLSITVSNPAPGGGNTGTLSLIVTDYNVSAPTPSQSITAGQPANYSLSLIAMNGTLAESVSFSASGLPTGANANFMPSSLSAGSASTTVMLSITTTPHTSASFMKIAPGPGRMAPRPPGIYLAALVFAMLAMASTSLVSRSGRSRLLSLQWLLALLLIVLATSLAACGSGSGAPDVSTDPSTGTPAGTYTIMVNATSGNSKISTPITLTVM